MRGAELTANAFAMLGTPPFLGRTLSARDEVPSEPPVVVLSQQLDRCEACYSFSRPMQLCSSWDSAHARFPRRALRIDPAEALRAEG